MAQSRRGETGALEFWSDTRDCSWLGVLTEAQYAMMMIKCFNSIETS